jgi:alkanesulfonate monooxygenase SsuD/methylene tetrahydromethanopterin reductase-like flavin-dependent oxidoreductase (luciferase family)
VKLALAFGWHTLGWEALLALTLRAEGQGFDAVYTDGDISQLGLRSEVDTLDGWTQNAMLLAKTSRIGVGSIRLVHHWNAAKLAQAAATVERIAPGRQRFFISVGDRPEDPRFGLPTHPVGERIAWLDESLTAIRALWRGDAVTQAGRFVRLDAARVRPTPPGGCIPIEIAAKSPRLLAVVARHADIWNVNLPPDPALVGAAESQLSRACEAEGRDPASLERSLWIFTRVQQRADPAAGLAEFRRSNPWFGRIPDAVVADSIAVGEPAAVVDRVATLAGRLRIDRPILDLAGAPTAAVDRVLAAFPGGKIR